MTITINKKQFILLMLCLAAFAACCYFAGLRAAPAPQVEEVVKYVEVIKEAPFDTSALENWDGDFSNGRIRMVGAWLYGHDTSNNPIVVDENNELWTLPNFDIQTEDFVLLWIADEKTPENVHDDIVVKVWVEEYEGIG